MPSNNDTPPRSRGAFPARDPRSAGYAKEMNRRRQANTVAIRKQRKEERLWKRRQGETTSATTTTTATAEKATLTTATNKPVEPLSADLLYQLAQQYCQEPHPEKLVALQKHMAHKQSETHTFLDQLLHNRISKCRLLVQLIAQQIHTLVTAPQHDNYNTATLGTDPQNQLGAAPFLILLDISSHDRSSDKNYNNNNNNNKDQEESYYGRPPPRWCDILLETTNLVPQLIHYLIAIPSPSTSSTKNEDDSTNINIVITETIANIIGNLLQDAPSQTLPQVLPVWDPLVQKLPSTAYLCAAAVRQDGHHYGTDFLQALTPHVVAKLLHTNPYDAVWILEGLSKREEAAIDILCSSTDLLAAFAQSLEKHIYTNDKQFLVPALKAMANFCGSARHVISFLSLQLPPTADPNNTMDTESSQSVSSVNGFIPLVAAILDNGQIVDVLPVVSALVSESGIPNHPATMIAFPVLVPRLIQLVCSDQAVFYWKREAVWAMNEALCDYSTNDDNASNSNSGNSNTRNNVKSTLETLALTFFWNEHLPVPRDRFLEALADLLMGPDLDATTAVMHLLDKLLRMVPASRSEFETAAAGVHCLEQICVRGSSSGDWEVAANLAANLLDDFFDTEEDDDIAMQGFYFGANEAGQNQVSFGMQQQHQRGDFDFSQSGFSTPAPTGTSRGRGRGMTLPAWMQKS